VYRAVALGCNTADFNTGADGVLRIRSPEPLQPYPRHLLDRLAEGAVQHPERTFVAQRGSDGAWRRISYAQMLHGARSLGQTLLQRGLSVDRPLLILSGNDLEHLQLSFGAMWAGIPYCPVSPAYSLMSQDFEKLRHVWRTLTPGMVFAADGTAYERAIAAAVSPEVEVVLAKGTLGREWTRFEALVATTPTPAVDAAFADTGPDTVAKFLFTSGSTRSPKAVITTQRMLCSNQQMILQSFPFLGEEPPVLVDWLPWNHTFGGNHNVGIALYNGGTLYVDDGKPTPQGFVETVRNLREIAPTVYFNVPRGWEELAVALETDAQLRRTFFSRVRLFMFAGAGLSQATWDRLERVAEAHCGKRIRVVSGLGMTETSPSCTFATLPGVKSGHIGLPCPGCEVKLVPVQGKLEARFRGPHIMPGYWRAPEQTQAAFDEDGYYCSGDAVALVDPAQPRLGLMFDGRLAEDFKLSSATFVSVGPLRSRVILEGAPYIQDVVVTGPDRDDIGILVFPNVDDCRSLAGLRAEATTEEVLRAPAVRAWLQALLDQLNRSASGSSTRIARARLLLEPPSIDKGEITDKRSINQRAVLNHRAALVESLYTDGDPEVILPRMAPRT